MIGETPLHLAAAHGHDMCVRALLHAGANAECKDVEGRTAMEVAKRQGFAPTASVLQEQSNEEPVMACVPS